MAPPSNLPLLLRAAASHRNATRLLNLHCFSSTPFLHSNLPISNLVHTRATTLQNPLNSRSITNPPNLPISKPHLFPTTLRVHTRASALLNPLDSRSITNLRNSSPHFFSTSTARRVHTRATTPQSHRRLWLYGIAFACIATGLMVIQNIPEKSVEGFRGILNENMELKVRGVLPGVFREGHSVVVEAFVIVVTDDWEYYASLTEVLAKPENINAAMERNQNIIAVKLKVAEEEKLKIAEEEKLKIAEGAEQEAAVDRYTTSSEAITKPANNPLKNKLKGKVIALPPRTAAKMTRTLKKVLVRYQGLSELLQEGDSVFIKVLEKHNTDEIKESQSDEILEDKLADISELAKGMTVKLGGTEYHISVEVFSKHDEKFMLQEVAAVVTPE